MAKMELVSCKEVMDNFRQVITPEYSNASRNYQNKCRNGTLHGYSESPHAKLAVEVKHLRQFDRNGIQ